MICWMASERKCYGLYRSNGFFKTMVIVKCNDLPDEPSFSGIAIFLRGNILGFHGNGKPVGNLQETCLISAPQDCPFCQKLIRTVILRQCLRGALMGFSRFFCVCFFFHHQQTPSNLYQTCIKSASNVAPFSRITQGPNFATYAMSLQTLMETTSFSQTPANH